MLKRLEITTTYGSKMLFPVCLTVNFKTISLEIVYEHSDTIRQQTIYLKDIKDIKISLIRGNNV